MADNDSIPAGKYPGKLHLKKVVAQMRSQVQDLTGVLYLESQKKMLIEDSDEEVRFRQRRYFYYVTGCELANCHFTYDIEAEKSTLFIPPIDPDEVIWSGMPMTPEEALDKYDVDLVLPSTSVNAHLASASLPKTCIYAINGQVSDDITFLPFSDTDFSLLRSAIEASRVTKTAYEIALIRHANAVTAKAHLAVMRAARLAHSELDLEAAFIQRCIEGGCRSQAYSPIVAAGTAAATLHYVNNDAPLEGKLNLLLDAGAGYRCYGADVTRTFPLGGRPFSEESRAIYEIVLEMQRTSLSMLRKDVLWEDVHVAAHKVAIDGLLALGILRGDKDEIFRMRTSVAFFPHGLGHYLGLEVHDVGGNPNFKDQDPMFKYLRLRGKVPDGGVVTVEPGLYFCRFIIEPYVQDPQHAKFIEEKTLERYWDVGGVRIEDNVVITEDGHENLTTVPKEVKEIEQLVLEG